MDFNTTDDVSHKSGSQMDLLHNQEHVGPGLKDPEVLS